MYNYNMYFFMNENPLTVSYYAGSLTDWLEQNTVHVTVRLFG